MTLQPLVRVLLTVLAAGIGAAATQIDNETLQIAAAVLVPTLAAIGIVPPQVPTKTVVDAERTRKRSSWGREGGYGLVELLVALVLLVLLIWLVVALVPDADAAVAALRSSWG